MEQGGERGISSWLAVVFLVLVLVLVLVVIIIGTASGGGLDRLTVKSSLLPPLFEMALRINPVDCILQLELDFDQL